MFSTFKKFFGLRTDEAMDSSPSQHASVATVTAPHSNPSTPRPVTRHELPPRQVALPPNAPVSLLVPLKPIIDRLPAELQQRVRQLQSGDAQISVSMQKILSQIPQGIVKITFGELRLAAPPGTFSVEIDRDRTLVEIPLQEILCRIDASLMARRPRQRQVVVPPEVTGPFGGQAKITFSTNPVKGAAVVQTATVSNGHAHGHYVPTPAAPAVTVAPVASPKPQPVSVAPVSPLAPAPLRMPASTIAPVPVAFKPIQPAQPVTARIASATAPISPIAPAAPIRPAPPFQPPQPPQAFKPVVQPVVARIVQPAVAVPFRPALPMAPQPSAETPAFNRVSLPPAAPSAPIYSPIAPEPQPAPAERTAIRMPGMAANLAPAAPISPIAPEPEPEPQPIRFQAPAPEPPVVVAPPGPVETRFLSVSVCELSGSWPEAVQQEIEAHHIANAIAALPFGLIELAIRQGKIAVPWRIIRSWIQAPAAAAVSPHDNIVLELPLKLITPLFLSELRSNKAQKKITIDQSIPDLFSNRNEGALPAPVATPPPTPVPVAAFRPAPVKSGLTPKPADTNYFARLTPENQPEEPAPVVKQGPTPGTAFLVRYATPNEIVTKAAALDGVDGALIALPDGLLVASRIPPTMNADTIAAFLPQIFGRVSQCTKELRLGELNNLNFTVGNIPWKIFKVGAIYFAAFGRVGEALPSAQLAAIAAELDRKAK